MSANAHYREAHPLVFVITHWINLICMIMLAFSGFYIHYPFFDGFMGVARGMHFVAMFVIIINLTFRIIAAFFVKTAVDLGSREVDTDIKNWLPQEKNKHQFFETVTYYLFFRKEGVISAKYGSLQKIAYLATIPLTYLMAYTGFCLYGPTADWGFFAGGTARQRAGWQVMQLWDTREDLERFNDDVHLPAVARLGGTDFPQAPSCAVSTPSTSGSAMRSCAEQLRAALQCRVRRVSAHISVQLSARP